MIERDREIDREIERIERYRENREIERDREFRER